MERLPFSSMPVNPRITNNFLDSCAFDPKTPDEYEASRTIECLYNNNEIILIIAHSVEKEIEHPNTPEDVKEKARGMIRTLATGLTTDEVRRENDIRAVLSGNGNPKNYQADARHLFLADKYGGHFITLDGRILQKRDPLKKVSRVHIFTPSEWLEHYQRCAAEDDVGC